MRASSQKVTLSILLLSGFIDYAGVALVYPLFAYMLFSSHHAFLPADASETVRGFWLGFLIALQPLAQFFSSPILGTLSDYEGRKKLLIFSLFLALIGYTIAVWGICTSNLFLLLIYRIIVGIAGGNASIVSAIIADVSAPEKRAKNYGLLNMSFGAGFTIGPFLGGFLADRFETSQWGLIAPFALALILVLVNLIFVMWKLQETHPQTPYKRIHILAGLYQLKRAVSMADLRGVFLSLLLFTFGWTFFTEFIPLFLIDRYAFAPKEIGYYYGYTGFFYAISAGLFIQPLLRILGARTLLFASLFLSGIYIFFFLWISNPNILWLYLPLSQFLMAFVYPTTAAVISNRVSDEVQGEALGIYQAIIALAMAISPLFSGILVGPYPSLSIVIGGAGMVLSGCVFGLLDKK